MLNRIILIGRLTRDPDLKYTPTGIAVATFSLAVDRNFRGSNGEKEVDFIPIVTWRQLAETCANYLRKGRLAAVEGRIQVRNYENNEGKRVYVTEVIADNVRFLESSQNREGGNASNGGNMPEEPAYGGGNSARGNNNNFSHNSNGRDPFSGDGKPIDISDDDLPF